MTSSRSARYHSDRVLTTYEAALNLDRTTSLIGKMCRDGKFPSARKAPINENVGIWLIDFLDVERYRTQILERLDNGRQKPGRKPAP